MVWARTGRGDALILGSAALILAGAIPALGNAQQRSAAAAPLAFDSVTVIDVETGNLLPDQRVVIQGNRIRAVGKRTAVALPKGARVVSAKGKYLVPGLWDMHVHPSADSPNASGALSISSKEYIFYPLFIAYGITGIRDAWATTPLDTLVRWRQEILDGTRVGPPRELLAGASFGQHYESHDSVVVAHIVDSLKAIGANFLKVYPYTPTVAAAARRAGLQFGGHVHGGSAIEASNAGMSIIDHANSAGDLDKLCLIGDASVEQCRPVAEAFRRNGTWWAPTLVIFPGVAQGGGGKTYALTPQGRAIVNSLMRISSKFWWDTLFVHHWLHTDEFRLPSPGSTPDSLGFLRIAQRVGMPILSGTDVNVALVGGVGNMLPGLTLHAELAILVAEGLTPLEALQAATLNPAKMLHGTDSLGTVAPGKLADLVLLDANPLADITNTTAIRAVVANGRYYDRPALDSLLTYAEANGP